MATPEELRRSARTAEQAGKPIRAQILYAEADRLEAEQAAAAGRPTAVSSGGAVGPSPTAPMPQTFRPPPASTFVPEPAPPPRDLSVYNAPPPEDFVAAGPPAPGTDVGDFVLEPRDTGVELARGIGTQQTIAIDAADFTGLLGDQPVRTPSMLGIDARTDVFQQYGRTQKAIEDFVDRRTFELAMERGLVVDEARRIANREADRFRRLRADPEGRPTTTGEGGLLDFIPQMRESRIIETEAIDPEGNVVVDEGGFPVMTRMYRDPETGTLTVPTDRREVVESFARQTLPLEEVERNRAERAAMVQQMYQSALDQGAMMLNDEQFARIEAAILDQATPYIRNQLTSLDRESGKMVETAAGAGLRSFGAFPAMFNEAIMEYTPLFWEQDPETGKPVDPNSYAYRAHEFLKQNLEAAGYTPKQVQNLTTGPIGLGADGVSPGQSLLTMLPKPFQPVQRQQATPMDPTGRRAVPAEASFAGRVAAAIGTIRSGGDELMSMPGMRGETANAMLAPGMGVLADQDVVFLQNNASSVPFFVGVGAEMIYPGAPLIRGTRLAGRTAAKATQTGAGVLKRAAKGKRASYLADVPPEMRALLYPEADVVEAALKGVETAADVTEKGAYALSHPVEAAARTRAIRRAQELTEGRHDPVNELDLLKSMHDVRRVTGEATATEILAPYAIQSVLDASEEAVTVQRLIDTIGESPTGRAVLEQADLLNRPGTHVVGPNEVEKLRQAVAETNVSSMRTMLLKIADDPELSFQQQAQNILNQMHAAGIQTRYLPEMQDIRAIANGAVEASPKTALQQMFGPLPTRVQQVAQRPTVQALHELGTQIVRQAQSDEVRRVSGEAGRIMARRLGSTPINRTTIGERPDEIFAAARAAGGRLVEARLANAVPDDFVFATKTLMVPRNRLTDEVMFEVSKRVEPFQPEAMVGPVVDGERTVVFRYPLETTGPRRSRVADEIMGVDSVGPAGPPRPTNIVDEIIAAVGVDNIAQSRQYTNIISDIRAGKPLTLEQSAAVQEALQTRAFQEVMGPYAMPSMGFQVDQPRQFERAMQPGVNVRMERAREKQVPMTRAITMSDQGFSSPLAQDLAMVVGEGGGRQIAKVIRDATRDLSKAADELPFDVPPETAPGYQELLAQVRNEFGAISENLRIEMRDIALQPAYKGKPQAAFNAVLRKRVERKMRDMEEAIDQRARELQSALRADPKQAYFAIAYRRGAGQDLEGLGEQAANIPDDIRKVALDRERVRIMRNEWESILRDFFGDDAYKAYIEEADLLDDIIKVPGLRKSGLRPETLADIQPISIKGLVDVVEYTRGRQGALRGVGAAVGRTPATARDAITPVLESWAIGVDQGEAIARANRTLRRENPQLFADLLPSAYSQRPERVFREASLPLTIRRNTMRALRRLSVPKGSSPEQKAEAIAELNRDPRFKQFITRAVNEDGQFYVDRKLTYAMDQTGKFTGELDNIARNMGLRLDPRSRQDLAQQVITQMLETGSPVVDYGKLLRTFDDSPNLALQTMQKQATTEALGKLIRGMDLQVSETQRAIDVAETARITNLEVSAKRIKAMLERHGRVPTETNTPEGMRHILGPAYDVGDDTVIFKKKPEIGPEHRLSQKYPDITVQSVPVRYKTDQGIVDGLVSEKVTPLDKLSLQDLETVLNDNFTPKAAKALAALAKQDASEGIGSGVLFGTVMGEALRLRSANAQEAAGIFFGPYGLRFGTSRRTQAQNEQLVSLVEALAGDPLFDRIAYIARAEKLMPEDTLKLKNVGVDAQGKFKLLDIDVTDTLEPEAKFPVPDNPLVSNIENLPPLNNLQMNRADVAAFANSPADAMLYKAIQDARRAGYDDEFITQMLRQSILETSFNTTIAPIVDEVTTNMRAAGFKPQLGKGNLTNMATLARSLDPYDDAVMVLGPDMSEAIAELQASARSGQLAKNLEQLRRRDELTQAMRGGRKIDYLKVGASYVSDASALSRRAVASGLLGGGVYVGVANFGSDELRTQMQEAIGIEGLPVVLPMPNSRYIGMNALTAPIIAFTTVGMNKAVKAYRPAGGYSRQARDVGRQLSTILNKPLVNANANVPVDSVRFVSDTGRTWTQGEVLSAINRNNLGSSRGQVEYTEAFVQEAQRDIRLMADGLPTPELRQFARQFDPTRTNIAQYVANASDKALRENIFVTALREGLPEAQAAQLARNVVLDYGAIPPVVRNTINRHVLFASFRLANYAATVNALARDPIMFQKLVRAQQVNQQRTDAWLMGPDYTKARTLLGGEVVFDQDAGAGLFGPALPAMDAMVEMMQMASFIGNVGAEGNDAVKRALDAAKEENLVPVLSLVIDNYLTRQDPTGRGMRVPTDVVEWAIQNGPESIWPYVKERYNIEPVSPERRLRGRPSAIDPQAPELGPNEYQFRTTGDAERFKKDMTILLYMGIKRTTTDYTNLEMQFNPSDYLRVKRQGIDPTYGLLFGAGAATPLPMGSMSEPARSILRKAEKAARQAPPQQ